MNNTNYNFVHPNAQIADSAVIEPFVKIEEDVIIGEGTLVRSFASICNGARIGNHCQIYEGAIISPVSQDLKYNGTHTTVEIGDYTVIREYASIHKGTEDRKTTKIGNHCLIMAYAHIAHDCILGDHVIMANSSQIAGHVVIGDWAILEGVSGVGQFVHIGSHSFLGAYTRTGKDIPPYVRGAKHPISFIGINTVGLRRRGFSDQTIKNIENIYKILYRENLNTSNALKKIKETIQDSKEKQTIIDFIEASEKGIIK